MFIVNKYLNILHDPFRRHPLMNMYIAKDFGIFPLNIMIFILPTSKISVLAIN